MRERFYRIHQIYLLWISFEIMDQLFSFNCFFLCKRRKHKLVILCIGLSIQKKIPMGKRHSRRPLYVVWTTMVSNECLLDFLVSIGIKHKLVIVSLFRYSVSEKKPRRLLLAQTDIYDYLNIVITISIISLKNLMTRSSISTKKFDLTAKDLFLIPF